MKSTRLITDESYIIFFTSMSGYEMISSFWDQQRKTCNHHSLLEFIPTFPRKDQIMARFFLSIWAGENCGFDIITDVFFLNNDDVGTISDWLLQPYVFEQ